MALSRGRVGTACQPSRLTCLFRGPRPYLMPFNSVIFFGSPLSNKKRGRCAAPRGLGFSLFARTVTATAAGWIASLARVVAAVSLFGHMFDSFYFEGGGCEGRKSGAAVSPTSDHDVRDYSRLCSYSSLFGLHWLAWLSSSGPWFILGSFYPGRLELDDPGEWVLAAGFWSVDQGLRGASDQRRFYG